MTAAVVAALGFCVALLGFLVVGVLRTHAEVLRRLHQLGAGLDDLGELGDGHEHHVSAEGVVTALPEPRRRLSTPERSPFPTAPGVAPPRPAGVPGEGLEAPSFTGTRPDGRQVVVDPTAGGGRTLLAFLTTGCTTCAGFWASFGAEAPADLAAAGTRLVVVTRGPNAESPADVGRLAAPLADANVTVVQSDAAWDDYRVEITPFFVLVDGATESVVGEGAAATWDQVGSLLTRALADVGIGNDGVVVTASGRAPHTGPAGRRDARSAEEARIDKVLLDAGIRPGDSSLYPDRGEGAGS